jgi:hypothetical protein
MNLTEKSGDLRKIQSAELLQKKSVVDAAKMEKILDFFKKKGQDGIVESGHYWVLSSIDVDMTLLCGEVD